MYEIVELLLTSFSSFLDSSPLFDLAGVAMAGFIVQIFLMLVICIGKGGE